MSIETWAKKIAEAMRVMPGERPSFAAVLVDFIDEYDELAKKTKLSVPVFARALTTAGLTSASGRPCDPNALRMQIKRARERRLSLRATGERNSAYPAPDIPNPAPLRSPHTETPRSPSSRDIKHVTPSVLMQLQQSKPKKVRPLDGGENDL